MCAYKEVVNIVEIEKKHHSKMENPSNLLFHTEDKDE